MPTNKTNIANQLVNAGTELDNMANATRRFLTAI